MEPGKLLKRLLETDSVANVRDLLAEFCEEHALRVGWRPVGDKPNNSGPVGAASDPARALLERVTNGIDAVIERAYQQHAGQPACSSPREAAQAWFAVPRAGLHAMSNADARKLAQESVTIALLKGDGPEKRTVDVIDRGTGLTQEQMPRTILSLNAENKLDKFYLAGAFGQGGSATFSNSEYTLIASSVGARQAVAFTVVRFQPPAGLKLGSYVYLTLDGGVLATSEIPPAFASTHIRHYGYDLDAYKGALGPNSLYGRSQAILFDPVLPFWFENSVHNYRRTIKGSRTALNGAREEGDPDAKLSHSSPIFYSDLGDHGQLGIEYWVLEPNAKSAPNKAFVNGNRPIVLTVNGQTHAEWSSIHLRKDAELMHLASRMVVHLDCNKLSGDAKRILFVSNREESRKNAVQSLILREVLSALAADPKLAELEEQARHTGSKARDEQAEKEIRREVARMLKVLGFSVAEDAGASPSGSGAPSPASGNKPPGHRKPASPIDILEPPTFVEIVGGQPIALYPGQRKYVRIRTNANSKYHTAHDLTASRFNFVVSGDDVAIAGTSELRDGHMRVVVAAGANALVGAVGSLRVDIYRTGLPPLSAESTTLIVKPPEAKQATDKVKLPNIDIQPVDSSDSEDWINLGWPEDIAEVALDYNYERSKDTLVIRYSTVFPRFDSAFKAFAAKAVSSGESFQRRYEMWLTAMVVVHWQDMSSDPTPFSDEVLEQEKLDEYRRDELRRFGKVAILYAQREVISGALASQDAGDE